MKKYERIIKSFDKQNIDYENLLVNLKTEGASQADIVKILIEEFGLSLADADRIVLNSNSWRELKNTNLHARKNFSKTKRSNHQLLQV